MLTVKLYDETFSIVMFRLYLMYTCRFCLRPSRVPFRNKLRKLCNSNEYATATV